MIQFNMTRLTPFEEYMFVDDRVDYPMSLFLRLRFDQELDWLTIKQALIETTQQLPRFRSLVAEQNGNLVWKPTNKQPVVTWSKRPSNQFPPAAALDLTREIGVKLFIQQQNEQTIVTGQFHHACCDGKGAMELLSRVFKRYAQLTEPAGLSEPNSTTSTRDKNPPSSVGARRGPVWQARRLWQGLARLKDFLRNSAEPMMSQVDNGASMKHTRCYPATLVRRFDAKTSKHIFHKAKSWNATVNDVLMRDAFLALSDWRAQHQLSDAGGPLRLLVPVDLRDDQFEAASNVVGMVFVDRFKSAFADSRKLLQSISQEMRDVKRFRLGQTSLRTLRFARAVLPGGLKTLLGQRPCWSSAVLSNLGRPFPPESLETLQQLQLSQVDFVAPIRPLTSFAFGVVTHQGCLSVTLQYDPRKVSADTARQLLDLLKHRLHRNETQTVTDSLGVPAV